MFKSGSLIFDDKKIKDFINKESNPFLKKSRNNFLKKLAEKKFNIKEEYKYTPLKQTIEKNFNLRFEIEKNISSTTEKKILPYIINDNNVYQIITLDGLNLIASFSLNFGFQPYFFAKEISNTFLGVPFGFVLSYIIFIFLLGQIKSIIN